ncbi:hypothetical protein [Ornithinimicrobium sp. CNJ-824]|nr:hypothetical protein [Ornithinimicrobium sp. CNJ-824]
MENLWIFFLAFGFGLPLFLLLRYMAAKRALTQAQRMREQRDRRRS